VSEPGRVTLNIDISVRVDAGTLAPVQELALELPSWIGDILDHRQEVASWKITKNVELPVGWRKSG
jgi:hypothetical protein